jgi:ankyrin repeat protein
LEQGVGVNDQDSNGQTPLHLVAQRGSSEIAKVLLKGGAKIDIRDNEGATPIYRAIENGNLGVYNVLFAWETFLSLAAYFKGND